MGFTLKNERKIYGTVLQKGNLMNEIRLAWVDIVLVSCLIPKVSSFSCEQHIPFCSLVDFGGGCI